MYNNNSQEKSRKIRKSILLIRNNRKNIALIYINILKIGKSLL